MFALSRTYKTCALLLTILVRSEVRSKSERPFSIILNGTAYLILVRGRSLLLYHLYVWVIEASVLVIILLYLFLAVIGTFLSFEIVCYRYHSFKITINHKGSLAFKAR